MRNQKNYDKAVGIIDDQVYVVNYTFEDEMHGEPFNGVTGGILVPLTQDYIDSRNDVEEVMENYRDLWVEQVKSNCTDLGLQEWVEQNIVTDYEGEFPGHDTSDLHTIEDDEQVKAHFPDAVSFECIGGGRCFRKNMQWDVIFDQHLVDEINRLEKEE